MQIAKRKIGPDHLPYIVAEIGANHSGSLGLAMDSIIAAIDAGASACKIQCYTADTITFKGDRDEYIVKSGPWKGQHLHDLYKSAETPPSMVSALFDFAKKNKITLFASVFDFSGVDLVVSLGAPAIKVASFEIVDTPLIGYAARTGLPMIISTGMATTKEIMDAANTFYRERLLPEGQLALLHCISNYPAKAAEANLPALGPLSELLGKRHVVGFSDHTLGIGSAVAAVVYGASIIEKHFILDRSHGGPDSSFSLEPSEFAQLTKACKEAWQAIQWAPQKLQPNLQYRKSVHVTADISSGDSFSTDNCRILRPASGLSPSFYPTILAGVATCDLKAGTPLKSEMVSTLC